MQFGEKIAAMRKSKGMTQAELGTELNVTFQAVSKWERDESLPDFATMSRMAKLFGVPLEYFAEEETGQAPADEEEEPKKMLGVCTQCGRVVYEGDEGELSPLLICKECKERARKSALRKKREEEEKREREKREAEAAALKRRAMLRGQRNKGLIVGGLIAGILFLIDFISICTHASKGGVALSILFTLLGAAIVFTFVTQLFWGGVVRNVCTTGGAVIGTPGVIFSLSVGGCLFLIVAKFFFALLRVFVFLITTLFLVVVASLIAPFTFVPRLLEINKNI